MTPQIFIAFFRTGLYGLQLIGKNEKQRNLIKQKWARMVLKTFGYSLEVRGKSPQPGAQIFVGNHISYLDIMVIMSEMPAISFIAKDEIRKWPIMGSAAAAAGTIFVNRRETRGLRALREQIVTTLKKKNLAIAIFPSGTTTLFEQLPWKKGAFEIAKQAQVPVQLFRIDYSPLRTSAYIDDDNLLRCLSGLTKIRRKSATLQWLKRFDQIDEPIHFAEKLRQQVIASSLVKEIKDEN